MRYMYLIAQTEFFSRLQVGLKTCVENFLVWRVSLFKITSLEMSKLATYTENCALLDYYAAGSGNLLPTFRDNLSVPSSEFKNPK